ncbi:class I SAM-dependent methyltransferase [Rhizobium leguminosarum]|uniref:class I SAM-dependent methyltransferase n=1 Tax=Rhizobium leguminosarum TaxID=384 RepID=UPI001C96046D|nr:class I SAM-dependent methyltransferase [Rhizobium leguminosarum]MBY5394650.1 class I SAM-dependent methyltransferase [Rhizobium leguminosarum]
MLTETNGGYDDGYKAVQGFWGTTPGSLVSEFLKNRPVEGIRALDVGAGEGKNAVALARAGASVDAVECSGSAIRNGRELFSDVSVNWIHEDALEVRYERAAYDLVVCYGLVHCLPSEPAAQELLHQLQAALKPGGTFILVSFNNGSHDLSAHPGFKPLLLKHDWFLERFHGWHMKHVTDSILFETHPHNKIPHHHSLTRLTAVKR